MTDDQHKTTEGSDGWAEKITRDDETCIVTEARRLTIADMRAAVEAISLASPNPYEQGGVRWAKARMLHALDEMEAAIP